MAILRDAVTRDVPTIAALIRESKAVAMPWLPVLHSLEEDEEWVASMLSSDHRIRVAASETDTTDLLGVIVTSAGWINHLYIAPSAQGRGLGTALLRAAKDDTDEPLQLWAFQQNARARSFYEAHGFVAIRMTDGDNEERQPDVLYRWTPDARSIRNRGNATHYSWGDGCDGFILVDSDEMLVIEEVMPPGTGETRHVHERARQFFYILDGAATMHLPHGSVSLRTGDGIEVVAGTPHRFVNHSEESVRFLVTSTPSTRGDRRELP